MDSTLLVGLALGMRHGTDPDHLTAIDGLCRLRPRVTNGLYFALGHGLVVTLLAVGIGEALAGRVEFLSPWLIIAIGVVTLWKLRKPAPIPPAAKHPLVAQPFLLGMILAAGFETASQLSAFALAGQTNPLLLGATFSGGMALVDGIDGYLAASTQNLATRGGLNAQNASRALGLLVVVLSFGLGGAKLLGFEWDRIALPIGLALFALVIGFRVWARSGARIGGGLAPEAGESAADISDRFSGSTLGPTLAPPVALPGGGKDLYIQQDKFHAQFAADIPAVDAEIMAATQRPVTESALLDPAATAAWKTIPSWFIFGSLDKNITEAAHTFMAQRAKAKETVDVKGASHVVMVSHPDAVVALIIKAATSVVAEPQVKTTAR